MKEITPLNWSKAGQSTDDVPTKIIKQNPHIFSKFFLVSFNESVAKSIFPSSLKHTDITPAFKKSDRNLKDNYRPLSILPNILKILEQCIFQQIQISWHHYSHNASVGPERDIVHTTVS